MSHVVKNTRVPVVTFVTVFSKFSTYFVIERTLATSRFPCGMALVVGTQHSRHRGLESIRTNYEAARNLTIRRSMSRIIARTTTAACVAENAIFE